MPTKPTPNQIEAACAILRGAEDIAWSPEQTRAAEYVAEWLESLDIRAPINQTGWRMMATLPIKTRTPMHTSHKRTITSLTDRGLITIHRRGSAAVPTYVLTAKGRHELAARVERVGPIEPFDNLD